LQCLVNDIYLLRQKTRVHYIHIIFSIYNISLRMYVHAEV